MKTNQRYINLGRQKLEDRLQQEAKRNSTDVIHPVSQISKTKNAKFDFDRMLKKREFPERYMYLILDGQNLLSKDDLKFDYQEINQSLCSLVNNKIWNSIKANIAEGGFYSKVEMAQPSSLFQE